MAFSAATYLSTALGGIDGELSHEDAVQDAFSTWESSFQSCVLF
jgi:hypothetical protein